MRIEVVTPPDEEPITLAEARQFCRIDADITDENDLIESLITAARELVETNTSRALAVQTIRASFDSFPCSGVFPLPRFPLISVDSVVYDDSNGDEQTLSDSLYDVVTHSRPGAIFSETPWPWTDGRTGCVRVTYQCGHYTAPTGEGEGEGEGEGSTPEPLPKTARVAMLYLINHWYEHRETVTPGAMSELPFAVRNLIRKLNVGYRFNT